MHFLVNKGSIDFVFLRNLICSSKLIEFYFKMINFVYFVWIVDLCVDFILDLWGLVALTLILCLENLKVHAMFGEEYG